MRGIEYPIPKLIPVYPLPGVVLFPKAILSLNILEPPYRSMVKDVLDSQGCIAMAHFKPGFKEDDTESPEVFPVVGVGRVINYEQTPEGNYKIILWGERRAEILEWIPGRPYPVARIDLVHEEEPPPGEKEGLRIRVRKYFQYLIRRDRKIDQQARERIDQAVAKTKELGFLVDSIAYYFLEDATEKQLLLEVKNTVRRERLLREFLVRHALIREDEAAAMGE